MRKRSLWTKHSTSLCGLPWRQPAAHPLGPAQLRASRAAVKALSQAELPLQRTRLLSAHVPFSGDLFSLLISEWMWLWGQVGLLSAGGEEPASGSSYQPAAQQTKGQSFQVPWCASPLSPCQQGKSHPHMILTTFWSTRATLSLDVLKERVIQNAWVCLLGEVRGHPLSWITLPFLICTKQRFYTLPSGKVLWIFTIFTVKNPFSCLPRSPSDLNLLVILTERDN